jgi:hypothetical protein
MHAAPGGSRDTGSELELLRARCWRQESEIRALGDTIAVLRNGATALAADNAELRMVIDCLEDPIDRDGVRRVSRRRRPPRGRCW